MSPSRALALLCIICGSLGIAWPSNTALAQSKKEFTLELRVDGRAPGTQSGQPLARNAVIPAGIELSMRVSADETIHLYVVDMEPGQWAETLFPQGGNANLTAREVLLLPQNGAQYIAAPGSQAVMLGVFASRAPIDKAACRALRLPCQPQPSGEMLLRGDGKDNRQQASDPPPGRPRDQRDGELHIDSNATLRAKSHNGRLLFLFPLRIRPAPAQAKRAAPAPG